MMAQTAWARSDADRESGDLEVIAIDRSRVPRRPSWMGYPSAAEANSDFDYQGLRIDANTSRSAAATMLSLRAEFGGWELDRVLRFEDGSRQVWMRRKRSPGLLPDLTP
jgi:hypothetical protein